MWIVYELQHDGKRLYWQEIAKCKTEDEAEKVQHERLDHITMRDDEKGGRK